MRTANPALNANTFKSLDYASGQTEAMTLQGTVNKTGVLLFLTMISAVWVWNLFFSSSDPAVVMPWVAVGVIGGFVLGLVTAFKKNWAAVTAPLYAVTEGLALGGISSVFEMQFPGIVIEAVALTFGTLLCLLVAYKSGLIRPSENFKLGVVSATGAIAFFYFVTFILGFFGVKMSFFYGNSLLSIAISVVIVIIAALNLVLDFDFIEGGAASGAPKYMEWYSAFGLLVTLVWLYIEILRLLAKLRSRE
ncbi:MAG: Bax inhibitor-1/YccA family protein [Bacteroidota bacterium]|nr:Bax inhibitor-1/YccA family protein [Bacteroidota bacterium]